VTRLPVEHLEDIRLGDVMAASGCPICGVRRMAVSRFLDGLLGESVTDVGFRRDLTRARGFCDRHTHALHAADRARTGSGTGAAVLLASVIAVRQDELSRIPAPGASGRTRRLAQARRPPACLACAQETRAETNAPDRLVDLLPEPAWAAALAEARLCFRDLLALAGRAQRGPHWTAIWARQCSRIRELREQVEAYVDNSSHDGRHRITEEDRVSVDEAAALLGGLESEKDDRTAGASARIGGAVAAPCSAGARRRVRSRPSGRMLGHPEETTP
jgi:hypothetical protein